MKLFLVLSEFDGLFFGCSRCLSLHFQRLLKIIKCIDHFLLLIFDNFNRIINFKID